MVHSIAERYGRHRVLEIDIGVRAKETQKLAMYNQVLGVGQFYRVYFKSKAPRERLIQCYKILLIAPDTILIQ